MSADSSCSITNDGDVSSQSTSSALFTSFAPLFSPAAHVADSTHCSSSGGDGFSPTSIIPVAASCAAGSVIAGSGMMPVAPTLFPFLPIPPYFASAQGSVTPVMMAVDLRSVYNQQSNAAAAAVTVKEEQPPSSSVTEDIDTQELTTRVRDLLQSHGLGQKLFGEAVLELSQGSVSELLAKPKPWSLLSAKGREPFLRMRAWLADPHGIERLHAFQSQTLTGKYAYRDLNFEKYEVRCVVNNILFMRPSYRPVALIPGGGRGRWARGDRPSTLPIKIPGCALASLGESLVRVKI